MKKTVMILLVVVLMLTGCTEKKETFEIGEDIFFDTKEECILSFFQTLTDGDMTKIYQHYALNAKTEGYAAKEKYEQAGGIYLRGMPFPAYTELYDEMGYIFYLGEANNNLNNFIYSIQLSKTSSDLFINRDSLPFDQYEWYIDEYEEVAYNDFLKEFNVKRIYSYDYIGETETIFIERAEPYGFDAFVECVALFEYDDRNYYLGFTLLELNNQYAIYDHLGYYSGVDSYGYANREGEVYYSKEDTDKYKLEVIYEN
jgi:hypothetical protein